MEGDNKEAPLKNRKKMVQSRYAKDGLPHSRPTRHSRGWPRPPPAGLRLAIQLKTVRIPLLIMITLMWHDRNCEHDMTNELSDGQGCLRIVD